MNLGFLYRTPAGAPAPFSGPLFLFLELVVVLGLALFRKLVLGYGFGELPSLAVLDAVVAAVLLLATLGNPLQYPLLYGAAYLVFAVSYLLQSPPQGLWAWFGNVVVLLLLAGFFPLLRVVSPLVTGTLLLAYVLVRAVLPMQYRDEAREALSKREPFKVGLGFLRMLGDHERFSLAREKFRWYLADEARSGKAIEEARRVHRELFRRRRELGVYHVDLSWIHADRVGVHAGKPVLAYSGVAPGFLRDEKKPPAGGVPIKSSRELVPNVAIAVGPVEVAFVTLPSGEVRVAGPPPAFPLALAR